MSTRTRSRAVRPRRIEQLAHSDTFAIAIASAVAVALGFAFLQSPATVDTISIHNPTSYDIAVEVRGTDGGWMPLSTVRRHTTTDVVDVIDQGGTWTFRLRAQGRSGGQLHLERDALEAAAWAVEIPSGVEAVLHDAGAPLPP